MTPDERADQAAREAWPPDRAAREAWARTHEPVGCTEADCSWHGWPWAIWGHLAARHKPMPPRPLHHMPGTTIWRPGADPIVVQGPLVNDQDEADPDDWARYRREVDAAMGRQTS